MSSGLELLLTRLRFEHEVVVAWSRVFANGNFSHTLDVVVTKGRVDIDAFLSSSCALAECQ